MRSTIARSWCARATRIASSRRCSRRRSTAARSMRSTPSISRWRACASWRASRCRARSGCNGGATCWRGAGRGEVDAHPVAAALRDVVVRYRLPPQMLAELIDARTFDLYDEPMASLPSSSATPAQTSSALIELAARILCDGRDPDIGELVAACRHRLRDRRAAARAADPCRARPALSAGRPDAALRRASRPTCSPARQRPSSAPCWPSCGCGRGSISARRAALLDDAPPAVSPALLPVALVRPALDRMERRRYRPFQPAELPQWRRQWVLWRAARNGLAPGVLNYSAAIARAADPLLEVGERAGAERAPLGERLGGAAQPLAVRRLARHCASGGNRPKLTFIGW